MRLPWLVSLSVVALWLGACLVDKGRCSPYQELNGANACVCRKGYVPDQHLRCQACGEHETSQGDVCECEPGFQRNAAMTCVPESVGLGAACTASDDCATDVPHCDVTSSSPYCTTTGCSTTGDCAGAYACDTSVTPSLCKRGPSGLGESCTSQEDCAGKEASYCELNRAKVCMVANCKVDADCFLGWECCDLRGFGLPTLCVREAACPVL